jgi:protein-disulfide isomerase
MTGSLTLPDVTRDHIHGSVDAPIRLLEYADYECPFCAGVQPIVKALQRLLGDDLCFAFRHYPLTSVLPHAEHAAETAEAAGAQGNFWGMHEMLFENQHALEDRDLAGYAFELGLDRARLLQELVSGACASRVREDSRTGVRAGVNGTPTFFVNGVRYDGAFNLSELLNALASGDYSLVNR